MSSEQATSAVLLSATQSVAIFSAMLPPFGEVRKTVSDPGVVNDVRMGEAVATSLTVGIGLIASSMVKSPAPAMIAVVSAFVLVAMYETVLATQPKEHSNG